ncbi:MAG TPA: mucoidy inhibitor MuiA family protein, partial [Streptosporangiaceae bacterium]
MADNIDLQAPIGAVTVYRDGARITRSGTAALQPGLRSVALANLPDSAEPESVRVAIRGENVALLEVEVNRRYGADPVRDETVRLRAEAERCRDAVRELDDADAAEQARLGFANHLSAAAATAMARAVSFGRASRDDLSQMAEHLAGSTASALASRRDIAARRRTAQRELEAAEQRLADAEERTQAAEFVEVAATIEATAAADAEIELSYHVDGASWEPLYDFALTGERLSASYLAEVTQRTGEDWPPVRLVLSTSRQGLSQTLPELEPWYISRHAPAPMRARMGTATANVAFASTAGPGAAPLMAEVSEAGISQVYRVARPIAV